MNTKITSPSISTRPGRVFVGLSGGVDSAVSAALLKEQGYDVTGVFIKGWQPDWMERAGGSFHCTWREERRDAMKVAISLGIPFLSFDFEKEYRQNVVDTMLAEYKAGRTPNPDVLCNKEIKFGLFWQRARELGADFIATGHYARIPSPVLGLSKDRAWNLLVGKDKEKDQSYFLWTLTQDDLAHTLFPIGHLEKKKVRALAKKFKLPVAEKKDSQGICFMGAVAMDDFLSHYIEAKPGRVMNPDGDVIGTHKGLIHYTVGERRGFEVRKKNRDSGPFYIVAKDLKNNTLIASDKEAEIIKHSPRKISLKNVNWINEPKSETLMASIRYRGEKLSCHLDIHNKSFSVEFTEPVRGLSLGQSIVFYGGETCLGGAIMDKVIS